MMSYSPCIVSAFNADCCGSKLFMLSPSYTGQLPPSSKNTAEFLLQLNDLLDVLNSSQRLNQCRNKRAISAVEPTTAEEHLTLLRDADEWLGRWSVGDGAVIKSIAGLQQTIRGVQVIWEVCQRAGFQFLCTRRLNQDPLENLFSVIRQRGGARDNPDPTQFRHAYKHAILNGLLMAPSTASCEQDPDGLVAAMTSVAARTSHPAAPARLPPCRPEPEAVVGTLCDPVTDNVLAYVAGFLVHAGRHACHTCDAVLVKPTCLAKASSEVLTHLKSYTGVGACEVGSLRLPSPAWHKCIQMCYRTCRDHARSMVCEAGICRRLVECMLQSEEAASLQRELCSENVLRKLFATYTRAGLPVSGYSYKFSLSGV